MTVGKLLAEARIAKGLSIEDVSRITRIRPSQIQALEADTFDSAEATVFVRARIRAVATCVGLNEAEALAAYEASGDSNPADFKPALAVADNLNIFDHEKKAALPPRRSYTLTLIITGLVLLGLAVWFSRSVLMGATAPMPLPTVTLSASPTETASEVEPEPSATPTEADPAIVSVNLAATEASWIQVKAGTGDVLIETTLQPGDALAFTDAAELTVRVGNAGGVDFEVNGVRLGPLGETGQVVDKVFGLGDPTALG
ncbi:MAG: hypothetical protein RL038_1291 [Actinomycetota bacterium]|jgi:cytoskeletal protein RodZ